MSANNWGVCPRCKAKEAKRIEAARANVRKTYGKVDAEQYTINQAALAELERAELPDTLREDWEIGVNDCGLFFVSYRYVCQEAGCGFEHHFTHEQQLKV